MSLKEFLQGTWLGHPLHPAVVHIPTGLWPAALVLDILTQIWPSNALVQASFYAILVGLIAALAAVPTGIADWWDVKRGKRAWTLGLWHMALNIVAFAVFLVSLVLRAIEGLHLIVVGVVPLLLSLAGVSVLLVSGYLGGRMVYEYGVGVARQSKDKWRRIAEAGGAQLPEE